MEKCEMGRGQRGMGEEIASPSGGSQVGSLVIMESSRGTGLSPPL